MTTHTPIETPAVELPLNGGENSNTGANALPVAAAIASPLSIEQQKQLIDLAGKIQTSSKEIAKLEAEVEEAKGKLKSAEAQRDIYFNEQQSVIRGEGATLFDNVKPVAKSAPTTEDAQQAAFNAAPVKEILEGIPAAKIELLEADGIKTGKDLQAWIAKHPPQKISGIGEKMVEKITELMAQWFEKHPVAKAEAKPATESETIIHVQAKSRKLSIAVVKDGEMFVPVLSLTVGDREFYDLVRLSPHHTRREAIDHALTVTISCLQEIPVSKPSTALLTVALAEQKKQTQSETPHTVGQKNNGKDPGAATKGAAHKRAMHALIDALDSRIKSAGLKPKLKKQVEQMRYGILTAAAGKPMDPSQLITLAEAETLLAAVEKLDGDVVKEAALKGE